MAGCDPDRNQAMTASNVSFSGKSSRAILFWFLIANVLLCAFVFREGLWGKALLSPLDILPAMSLEYRFMDPQSSGVPANHFIVDQVTYDLPIQHTIYEAYRHGEIPWWDPFTWAGRPLLAEAHINGTDPIRIANYLLLPFDLAYNWTRICHFIFGGLGMLFLLRHWRFPDSTCVLLALTYEFAGCQALYFGHPWIQASFNYYPLLWLVWDGWFQKKSWWRIIAAAFLIAGIFYSGNLQSHAYLVLFAGAIGLGYGALSWERWKKIISIIIPSAILGALMAMPVLLNELELYSRSVRSGELEMTRAILAGWASLSAIYPWAMGTFRTLDLAKIVKGSNMGFHLFIGSAGVLLATLAMCIRPFRTELAPAKRASVWLVATYFLIVCTPLQSFLYARSAGLGVLGLVVLAAIGVNFLAESGDQLKRWGWLAVGFVVVAGCVLNVTSFFIYPKFIPKIRQMVYARNETTTTGFKEATALRNFQINNFANEVSFKNPETVIASLSLLGFAGLCFCPKLRRREWTLPGLLVLNLLPVVMFAHRFIPDQPIVLWQRLLAQGTEQRRVADIVNSEHLRLLDDAASLFEKLYPNAIGHLFQVHTVHGYSSLQPKSFALFSRDEQQKWSAQLADYVYVHPSSGFPIGELKPSPITGMARFQWVTSSDRTISVEYESLNEIRLLIGPGTEQYLLRTDTYYPGWSAHTETQALPIERIEPFFSKIEIPAGEQTLVLRYQPTYFRFGIILASIALTIMATGSLIAWLTARNWSNSRGTDIFGA